MRSFEHFTVIDWSGENVARPKGLAVAHLSTHGSKPLLVERPARWSRGDLLAELLRHADLRSDMLIGLDLSPGLPFVDCGSYFPGWPDAPTDAKELWRRVDELSTSDEHLSASGFLADADAGQHFLHQSGPGARYPGGSGRLRRCEKEQAAMGLAPYSCFRLIGAAQVGKSSLTGMRVLQRLGGRIPVWPFDPVPVRGPLIVEIYTSLAARAAGIGKGRSKMKTRHALAAALATQGCRAPELPRYDDDHATDALLTVAWLRRAAAMDVLWSPAALTSAIAATEGWTFGVP